MAKKDKPTKIEFAPGCFDNFDGTQEELDQLIAEIQRMADSGELEENATVVNFDEPDEETMEAVAKLVEYELLQAQKKLQ